LRHHLATLLIDNDCDVKTVQARMRHQSARTTLDVYGHLWPDKDETTRTAIGGVIAARWRRQSRILRALCGRNAPNSTEIAGQSGSLA
jgi:integrase